MWPNGTRDKELARDRQEFLESRAFLIQTRAPEEREGGGKEDGETSRQRRKGETEGAAGLPLFVSLIITSIGHSVC